MSQSSELVCRMGLIQGRLDSFLVNSKGSGWWGCDFDDIDLPALASVCGLLTADCIPMSWGQVDRAVPSACVFSSWCGGSLRGLHRSWGTLNMFFLPKKPPQQPLACLVCLHWTYELLDFTAFLCLGYWWCPHCKLHCHQTRDELSTAAVTSDYTSDFSSCRRGWSVIRQNMPLLLFSGCV